MTAGSDSAKETFENAMERLEEIVGQMESGRLPLEEMLTRYEEGTKLVKLCSGRLADAEKRIEIIARNAAGKPQVEEFDPNSPVAPVAPTPKSSKSAAASKPSDSDDVRLF